MDIKTAEVILFGVYTALMSGVFAFMIGNYKKYEGKYSEFTRLTCLISSMLFGSVFYMFAVYKFSKAFLEY